MPPILRHCSPGRRKALPTISQDRDTGLYSRECHGGIAPRNGGGATDFSLSVATRKLCLGNQSVHFLGPAAIADKRCLFTTAAAGCRSRRSLRREESSMDRLSKLRLMRSNSRLRLVLQTSNRNEVYPGFSYQIGPSGKAVRLNRSSASRNKIHSPSALLMPRLRAVRPEFS